MMNLTQLPKLSELSIDTFWAIRTVSVTKEAVTLGTLDRQIHESYSDVLNYLERKTILITLSEEYSRTDSNTAIFYLFSNALMLHTIIFLRDQTRGIPILYLLCSRMRNVLESLDMRSLQFQYPEMMLWILVIGGLGAAKRDDRQWYAAHLADACNASGLKGGDELAVALRDFMWIEMYRAPVFAVFWQEVARSQGVRRGYGTRKLKDSIAMCLFNNYHESDDVDPPGSSPESTPSPAFIENADTQISRSLSGSQ